MSDRNPARELADSGTPGPWQVGEIVPGVFAEHIPAYTDIEPCIAGGIDPTDAAKIVRAVNALPAIADLLDAIEALRVHIAAHQCGWTCNTRAHLYIRLHVARDAVEAALRGDA